MAKGLDTLLKVLGIVIAVLVILSIVVLLLRVMRPQELNTTTTAATDNQYTSLWYDPYWDWLNYPYYWFYPSERRQHRRYHDNHHPSTPTVSDAPIPTVSDAPIPTVSDAPIPTVSDAPIPTVSDAPILTFPDIVPEVTIDNSLIGNISGPILNTPVLTLGSTTGSGSGVPVINTDVVSNPVVESFVNSSGSIPEPWSNISSLPESF
jgi:hypothetical protein